MKFILVICCIFLSITNLSANDGNDINFDVKTFEFTGDNEFKGNKFKVLEASIAPVIEVDIKSTNYNYSSPIEAAASFERSMRNGDWDQFLKSWDKKASREILEKDRLSGRGKEFWLNIWSKRTSKSYLLKQARYNGYALISNSYSSVNGNKCCRVTAFIKTKKRGWRVTNDLASSPVLLYWSNPYTQSVWKELQ